ncbi:MAG TPA: hypothetical protein VMI92_08970 [Steroidobacteraceae bacterium]|nr:hypothetical protein [Steroidobacteraceae bacterium]
MTANRFGVKLVTGLLFCLCARAGWALDALVIEADSVTGPAGLTGSQVRATLALNDTAHAALDVRAAALRQSSSPSTWLRRGVRAFALQCGELQASEPQIACRRLALAFTGTPLGPQQLAGDVSYQSSDGVVHAQLSGLRLAGGTFDLEASGTARHWSASASTPALGLEALRKFVEPWFRLPAKWSLDGQGRVQLQAAGDATRLLSASAQLRWQDVVLQNEVGDIATDRLALVVDATLAGAPLDGIAPAQFEVHLTSSMGQALIGPVLADFAAAPLTLVLSGEWRGDRIELRHLDYAQRGLVGASGSASLVIAATPQVEHAQVQVRELDFPAAYTSLLQLALAGTDFGSLQSQGSATGQFSIEHNQPTRADLQLAALGFSDATRQLGIANLSGALHWRAAASEAVPSQLSWDSLLAYGLRSGRAALELVASGDRLALTRAARIPVFDGALAIERFEARGLGSGDPQLDFAARIEPIGMPQLSRAFGWPQMQGSLAGEIPGLAYRNHILSVAGDIKASVFGGTVIANQLVLQDPLGAWPKLSANFTARNLDLEQITRTFPIGSITGHLDADIDGLELFNWSPVAFDAHLYTTPGDAAKHRISQRAVTSISDIGGGGGGVAAALQSGFLKFFDEFGYSQIGLRCQLRDDVCLMSGIARPGGGFYIVKGGGLPRIDIIGNAGRVGWSQLLSQIDAALGSGNIVVQ